MGKYCHRRVNIGIAFTLFLATGRNMFSQADVQLLLRDVARACRQKYVEGYTVDIERWEDTESLSNSGPPSGYRTAVPVPTGHLEKNGYRGRMVMARLAGMFRFELNNAFGEKWQWTSNGQAVWCYRPDRNIIPKLQPSRNLSGLGPDRDLTDSNGST